MLLITHRFKVGDTIVVEGTSGIVEETAPEILVNDLLEGGLKWSITVWAETAALNLARDEAITAVRDALAHGQIGGPTQVTTVRLLGSAESRPPAT